MSADAIGSLLVKLAVDSAEFAAGLSRAQTSLATFSKGLKTFAASVGATLSLGAVGIAVKSVIDHMDELGKAAQKIGIPVEELSKLEYAGKLADVTLEDLTATLAKFSKNIAEVAAGGQNDAGNALKAIGVSATDAQGKLLPTTQIILDIAEEFSVMRDGANKTALAIALFGKSGAEMIPLLNGGRDAIASAGKELERFGGVVTQEAADNAQEYNDNITRLQTAFASLLQQGITPILPKLIELTESLIELTKTGSDLRQFLEDATSWLEVWGPSLTNTKREIDGIADALRSLGLLDKKPLEINIPGADLAPSAPKQTKDAPVLPNLEAIKKRLEEARKAAEKANREIVRLFDQGQSFADEASPLAKYNDELRKLNESWNAGAIDSDTYHKVIKALRDDFSDTVPIVNQLGEAFTNLQDGLAGTFSEAFTGLISGTESVKQAFHSMTQSITQMLAQIAQELIKSSVLKLLSIAAGSFGGVTVGGASFGGFYASGGTLGAGQWGIAGEAGPEIIHGPARITPMDKMSGGNPMNVQINNYAGADVQTRQGNDGQLQIDIVRKVVADDLARGGGVIAQGIERGYGLRRAGR